MSIARKPKKIKVDEAKITSLIEKGGSVAKPKVKKSTLKNVQMRLSDEVIAEIDNVREQDIVAPSRHTWILTAIKEKLERDK